MRITNFIKIIKIVRALWLAERRVCMRVCKHGCDVKMFSISRAYYVSMNLNKLSWELDKRALLTLSLVGWNLGSLYKTCCVNFFFCLSWRFKRWEKPVFWKALFFAKQDYACNTSCTRVRDWWQYLILISAITKRFAFFRGKVYS